MIKFSKILFACLGILLAASCDPADPIDDTLAKARQEGKSVMLELGSAGCIQCEQMKPVMQKLRDTYRNKLEVIVVDVRQDKKTASRFRVYMIPTQVFLAKDGKEFHRHIGYYAYDEIVSVLEKQDT